MSTKLESIKNHLNRITEGRWYCEETDEGHRIIMSTALQQGCGFECQHEIEYNHSLRLKHDKKQYLEAERNAKFITCAPGYVRYLVKKVESLKKEVEQLNKEILMQG